MHAWWYQSIKGWNEKAINSVKTLLKQFVSLQIKLCELVNYYYSMPVWAEFHFNTMLTAF